MKMMKKSVSVILALMMLVSLFAVSPVTAHAEMYLGFEYEIMSNGKARITGYSGDEKELDIPEQFKLKTVASIGEGAFAGLGITSVKLPQTVTTIEPRAFEGCKYLESVIMTYKLESISENAFADCGSLKEVAIPKNVTEIGKHAFGYRNSFDDFFDDFAIKSVDGSAAYDYAVDNGIKFLNLFPYQTLEDGTLRIISMEGKLESVELPEEIDGKKVTQIGDEAFRDHDEITYVDIPFGYTSIGERAFKLCKRLGWVNLPHGLRSIGDEAFIHCSLRSVCVPFTVTELGKRCIGYRYDDGDMPEASSYPYNVYGIRNSPVDEYLSENGLEDRFKEEFEYTIESDNTVTVTNYFGASYDIGLPSEIKGLPVKTVKGFIGSSRIRTLVLPDSVTTIKRAAFANSKIEEIILPNSLETIEHNAFGCCASLKRITIPKSVTMISGEVTDVTAINGAFFDCESLKDIIIEDGAEAISLNAFHGVSGLENVTIPPSVKEIGSCAFFECKNLKTVTIPPTVKKIGDYAFGYYNGYKYFYPPSHEPWEDDPILMEDFVIVGEQGSAAEEYARKFNVKFKALYEYKELSDGTVEIIKYNGSEKNIEIPDTLFGKKVSSIAAGAFSANPITNTIKVPYGIKSIGNAAFAECQALTNIYFPQSVKSMGDDVLSGCINLEYLEIPESVESIGARAFDNCNKLMFIDVDEESAHFASVDGVLYTKDMTELIKYSPLKKVDNYGVPITVTKIDDRAFFNCNYLKSAVFYDNVTDIGDHIIGYYWDEETSSVQKVSDFTVRGIPGSKAQKYAEDNGFEFKNEYDYKTLEDGTAQISKYYGANSDIRIPDEIDGKLVSSVKSELFMGNIWIEKLVIPDNITSLGSYSFANCSRLKSVELGANVTELSPADVFGGCVKLSKITVSEKNVEYSADGANLFNKDKTELLFHCRSDVKITVPDGVTVIGRNAFANLEELVEVNLPNSLSQIRQSAFFNCKNLTSITIPYGIKNIGNRALGYYKKGDEVVKVEGFVIKGFTNTVAETYAEENGFTFDGTKPNGTFGDCKWNFDLASETLTISGEGKLADNTSFTLGGEPWAAFKDNIKKLVIGNSVTAIGAGDFCYLDKLESATIGKSVETIGELAFSGCKSLEKIVFPESVVSIGSRAFADCESLTDVVFGSGVTKVGDKAFYGCSSLEKVNVPSGIIDIGDKAFGYKSDGSTVAGFKIKADAGSAAETYAKNNLFTFLKTGGEEETTAPAEEMQTISYLPNAEQNGKNIKVIINDKNGDYYIFTMAPTSDLCGGIPVYSVEIPKSIDPSVIQFQVFDGGTSIGKLTLTESQYSALKGKIITYDGKAYSGEVVTIPTEATTPSGVTYPTSPVVTDPTSAAETASDAPAVVTKKANTVKVTVKAKTLKLKKLKKKNQKVKAITVKNAKGKVVYKIKSIPKKLKKLVKISAKGVITIKRWKKAKKGTYKIKVIVTAKGNTGFFAKSVTKVVKVKVK